MKFKYVNIFMFYSIFGNIFERVAMNLLHKDYVSGLMGTIFTPVYGIAMLLVLFIHNKIKIKNKLLKILLEFIIYFIVLSILELLGGILIENVLNKIYWNYDSLKYNIGKYISLETSLVWSTLSICILYLLHPLFLKLEKYIPKWLSILVSIVFAINFIFAVVK